MRDWIKTTFVFIFLMLSYYQPAFSACETACYDIADEETAFNRIQDNIKAIEGEMAQIAEWQADPVTYTNEIALAAGRKVENANAIREILTDFFLYQKIAVSGDEGGNETRDYYQKLKIFHELLNAANLTKETYDLNAAATLTAKFEEFRNNYYRQPAFRLGQQITQASTVKIAEASQ